MMSYSIVQLVETPNRSGEMECFVFVNYTDSETGRVIPYTRWMSNTEYAQYTADHTVIDAMIRAWEAGAHISYWVGLGSPDASNTMNLRSFLKRIGRANRKQIRASTDANVIDGWDLIKSFDIIDVRDDAVIQAVDAWKDAGIINNNRRNEILAPL